MKNIKKDSRSLDDDEHLKELVNKVMIRNRRADTGIEWTKRMLKPLAIEFSQKEKELISMLYAHLVKEGADYQIKVNFQS